tara:strand:- start:232 stop:504 length:273 start_codon:yes stop_codon:yes gene_type:complete
MTYMAARAAGIDKSRSRRIAEWSEVIDEAFSLAALYHQRWVEKEIANGLGYGEFDDQIETIARKCGSANAAIRKSIRELEAERLEAAGLT